jgi:hypothetical protein
MPTHTQAYAIIRDEWPAVFDRLPTNNEILFTQAVAYLETGYGRIGQHGKLAAQGLYNWANIEKQAVPGEDPPEGWAAGIDSAQNVWFQVFPSDNLAARALIRTLMKRHWPTLQAAADPATPEAFAHAMKAPPAYYSAPEDKYAAAIRNSLAAIKNETGKTIDPPGMKSQILDVATNVGKGGNVAAGVAVGGGLLYLIWRYFFK